MISSISLYSLALMDQPFFLKRSRLLNFMVKSDIRESGHVKRR